MSDGMNGRMCLRDSLLGVGPVARRVATLLPCAMLFALACRGPVKAVKTLGTVPAASKEARVRRDPVGVASRTFEDASRGRRLVTTIWYPAVRGTVEDDIDWDGIFPGRGAWNARPVSSPRRLPLVLLSHGSGGDASNLAWLAESLATRRYIVAGVNHPGDQFGDVSVEGRYASWRRPRDVSVMLSRLLRDPTFGPRIDARRIAAIGHSGGGATVLLLAGARIRPADFLAYCNGPRPTPDCSFIAGVKPDSIPDLAEAERSYRDPRIRAVVAMDPVFGPAATSRSLQSITIPVEIIATPTDELAPFAYNAERYARLIPHARLVTIPQGGHFVFMPVCSPAGVIVAAEVCVEPNTEVDRAAVHQEAVQRITEFLRRVLVPRGSRARRAPTRPPAHAPSTGAR